MKKRGVFFSVVAILLAGLSIASFLAYNTYKYSDQMNIIEVRVSSMDDFISSIESDLGRALYISSFRALISMDDYITNTNKSKGRLLDNVSESFIQVMINGTIENNSEVEILMLNQTIPDWIGKIQDIGDDIGLYTNISINSISIAHSSPWKVKIDANFTVDLEDRKGLASWETEVISYAEVPITGFRDPLYANRTEGAYREIVKCNTTQWNVSNLLDLLKTGQYVAKNSSPTFLMRMEGNRLGSNFGILTLIDSKDLLTPENRSKVDSVYWRMVENDTQKIKNITDKGYPDFSLDPAHIVFFNVTGYNYTGP